MTDAHILPIRNTYGWEDPGEGGNADDWKGWMTNHSTMFDKGVNDLKAKMTKLLEEMGVGGNASDPAYLAKYQAALGEYNMYRMLQSNSTKSLSDQSKSVIRNLA